MSDQVNLDAIKKQLIAKKEEIQKRLEKIDNALQRKTQPLDKDFAEQAVERENDEVQEQLARSGRLEMQQINKALDRIDAGEYTLCSNCGGDIPVGRLQAIPFTELCVECAQRKE